VPAATFHKLKLKITTAIIPRFLRNLFTPRRGSRCNIKTSFDRSDLVSRYTFDEISAMFDLLIRCNAKYLELNLLLWILYASLACSLTLQRSAYVLRTWFLYEKMNTRTRILSSLLRIKICSPRRRVNNSPYGGNAYVSAFYLYAIRVLAGNKIVAQIRMR